MTELTPSRLKRTRARGVVLMLHGGAVASRRPVDNRSLSYRRAQVMGRVLAPMFADQSLGLELLRFAVRGWNDIHNPSPVPDARGALDELANKYDGLPVVLLGHSMGARTAVHVADHPSVTGVVGLAPWLGDDDPVDRLVGRRLRVVHGDRDRITSARLSAAFVERAKRIGVDADHVLAEGLGHYLVRGAGWWNCAALGMALEAMDGGYCFGNAKESDAADHPDPPVAVHRHRGS